MKRTNQKYECRCWLPYPNENMKRDNYWRCVDDYKCVRVHTCGDGKKTICHLKEYEEGISK